MSRQGYHNVFETIKQCEHKQKVRNEEGIFEWLSTWQKYNVARYHGKIERCSLCKQKRVTDFSGEGKVGYIEQASLFS